MSDAAPATNGDLTRRMRRELKLHLAKVDVELDAIKETARVFAAGLEHVPTQLQQEVGRINQIYDAKIEALKKNIVDAGEVITAKLDSQKEAATAQNTANERSIKKSEDTTNTSINALKDQVAALTQRLDRGDGSISGARGTRDETRGNIGTVVAIVACIFGAAGFAVAAFSVITSINHNSTGLLALSDRATYTPPAGFVLVPAGVPVAPAVAVPAAPR